MTSIFASWLTVSFRFSVTTEIWPVEVTQMAIFVQISMDISNILEDKTSEEIPIMGAGQMAGSIIAGVNVELLPGKICMEIDVPVIIPL